MIWVLLAESHAGVLQFLLGSGPVSYFLPLCSIQDQRYLNSFLIGLESINVQLSIGPDLINLRIPHNVHNGRLVLTQNNRLASYFDQEVSYSFFVLLSHFLITIFNNFIAYFCVFIPASRKICLILLFRQIFCIIFHGCSDCTWLCPGRQFYYGQPILQSYRNSKTLIQNPPSKITMTDNLYLHIWPNPSQPSSQARIRLPNSQLSCYEIELGERHGIVKIDDRIYGFGDNGKGQLGHDDTSQQGNTLVPIFPKLITNRIVRISCGWNHTLLLDQFGSVFSAGEGKNGALGHGRGVNSYSFKQVQGLANIKSISAGRDHSLAISSIKVYGWGNSMDGQLGIPKQKICYDPQQLYIYPCSLCFAGPKYSIFVTEKGIYATGQNQLGQLGLGGKSKIRMPKKLANFDEQVINIGGCSNYSYLQTSDNQFYISGSGSLGQYLYPTKIKHFRNCQALLLGDDFGVLKGENELYYSWSSANDNIPQENQSLNGLNISKLVVGPKMMVCQAEASSNRHRKQNIYSRVQTQIPEKMNIVQKNELMARSSIEYCEDYQGIRGQKKNRKTSEAIQSGQQTQENWSARVYDNPAVTQNDENDYCTEQQLSASRQEYSPKMHEQAMSPCFNRKLANSQSVPMETDEVIFSLRMRELEDSMKQNALAPPELYRSNSNKKMSLDMSKSILALSSDTEQQNIMSGTIKTIGKQSDQANRIAFLQAQNRKKDEQLHKLKKEMIGLMEVVEADMSLKLSVESKSRTNISSRRKELSESLPQEPDTLGQNFRRLKQLLGNTMDSLYL